MIQTEEVRGEEEGISMAVSCGKIVVRARKVGWTGGYFAASL